MARACPERRLGHKRGGTQSARTKSPVVGLGLKQLCQPVGGEARQANQSDNAERTHHPIGGR